MVGMDTRGEGTWHVDEPDKRADWKVATSAWAEAALPELERVASSYGASITYQELAERVQQSTGYRTRMLLANWIGQVLEVVVRRTLDDGLPPLTSLVVHKDTGGVGDGYYNREYAQESLTDPALRQQVAAQDRLTCYRAYCPDTPADAVPQMTELFVQKHARSTRRQDPPPEPVCPSCQLVLPLTGHCDWCD